MLRLGCAEGIVRSAEHIAEALQEADLFLQLLEVDGVAVGFGGGAIDRAPSFLPVKRSSLLSPKIFPVDRKRRAKVALGVSMCALSSLRKGASMSARDTPLASWPLASSTSCGCCTARQRGMARLRQQGKRAARRRKNHCEEKGGAL
jgi:hypothetical protein